jgi:hypothetical protein
VSTRLWQSVEPLVQNMPCPALNTEKMRMRLHQLKLKLKSD